MQNSKKQFIISLIENDILKFGSFTLKSGDISPFYIDLRLLPSFPKLFKQSIDLFVSLISQEATDYDHIGGLITAGVPFATGISLQINQPLLQIRPEPKDHGRGNQIEGFYNPNEKVILVDDLISTGASKIPAIKGLNAVSLIPHSIFVLIDRRSDKQIGKGLEGVNLYSIITLREIVELIESLENDHPIWNRYEKNVVLRSLKDWLN